MGGGKDSTEELAENSEPSIVAQMKGSVRYIGAVAS
jgi:hypothetical protein